jgi:iron(III) transport system permease protein
LNRELEEAAWLSGAAWTSTLRRVVAPLVWPAFAGGWLWVVVHAVRDAALAVMLFTVANDTVGARIWSMWFSEARPGEAAALAVCMALVTGCLSLGVIRTSMRMGQDL